MAKTVMVVDSDSDIRFTIKSLLEKNGYEVIVFSNCIDCLKKVKRGVKPHLILIESFLPKDKCLEYFGVLKGVKVAFLVSDKSEVDESEFFKNVVGFVEEPREIKEFLKKIKKLC